MGARIFRREIMTFTEFCAAQNIKLLRDDITFIKRCIKTIPKAHHKAVVRRYCEIWANATDKCERLIEASKNNSGRVMANNWLRTEGQGFRG